MEDFEEYIKQLNDDALIKMVTYESKDYTDESLELIRKELKERNIDYLKFQEEYKAKQQDEEISKNEIYDEPVLLTTVSNNSEAEVIESLLESYDIPVLHKDKGAGGFLEVSMGFTRFAVELYVPSKSLEKAKEIMENSKTTLQEESQEIEHIEELESFEPDGNYDDKRNEKQRSIVSWILLIIIGIPIVMSAMGLIMYLLYFITHSRTIY